MRLLGLQSSFQCVKFSIISLFLVCLWIPQAVARGDLILGSRYTSARAAALGDSAFTLGEEMASGLFYNPANLAKIRKYNFEGLNYSIQGSTPWVSNFSTNSLGILNLNSFAPTMITNSGQRFGAGWSFFPTMSLPYLTFGVLAQSEFSGRYNGNNTLTYRVVSQLIPSVGVGFRLFDGVLRVGYSLQFVNEAVGNPTVSTQSALNYGNGLSQGSALSHNFGLSLVIPSALLPTFSVIARNAFNANYGSFSLFQFTQSSTGVPATESMTLDGALAFNLRMTSGVTTHWSIAYRDIQDLSNCPGLMAHLGAGVELAFLDSFFMRLGIRTGYPSAGLGIKKPGTEISLAWYTEEVGTHYLDQGDSKFIFQYQTALY